MASDALVVTVRKRSGLVPPCSSGAGADVRLRPQRGRLFRTQASPGDVVSAMWYVTGQKNGVSALGLQRVLGPGSYETAWTPWRGDSPAWFGHHSIAALTSGSDLDIRSAVAWPAIPFRFARTQLFQLGAQLGQSPRQRRRVQACVDRFEFPLNLASDLVRRLQLVHTVSSAARIFAGSFLPPAPCSPAESSAKEVLVEPQHSVNLVQYPQFHGRVESPVAHYLAHMRPVLLLDPGIVVLLVALRRNSMNIKQGWVS